jgi:hypothetical protein
MHTYSLEVNDQYAAVLHNDAIIIATWKHEYTKAEWTKHLLILAHLTACASVGALTLKTQTTTDAEIVKDHT